jgi:hypothetical protein
MPSQKLIDELEIIIHRNKQFARRQELFDADPTCGVCTARVEHVEDCGAIKLADGTEYLCHDSCFQMQIEQMALRYFGKARTA